MKKKSTYLKVLLFTLLLVAAPFFVKVKSVQAATPGTPKLVSATASGTSKITVKWEKATNATGYRLYRKLDGGSWAAVVTLSGNASISYVDTTVAPGTRYYYTVRAYNKADGVTTWSTYDKTGVTATTSLDAPVLKSAKQSGYYIVTFSWGAVNGADGYIVYKKVDGKWVQQAWVTGTYWIDLKASVGSNIYTVKAYKKNGTTNKYSSYNTSGIEAIVVRKAQAQNALAAYNSFITANKISSYVMVDIDRDGVNELFVRDNKNYKISVYNYTTAMKELASILFGRAESAYYSVSKHTFVLYMDNTSGKTYELYELSGGVATLKNRYVSERQYPNTTYIYKINGKITTAANFNDQVNQMIAAHVEMPK